MQPAPGKQGTIYLIPSTLGDSPVSAVLPPDLPALLNQTEVYLVENLRSARRFLRKAGFTGRFDELQFFLLNKHTPSAEISSFLAPALAGKDTGIISEAGCPGVADPGAAAVALAHEKKLRVVPLVGPSSILLALMASGFNGQSFAFGGYLPIEPKQRAQSLKKMEKRSQNEHQTQIFMETPFRNNRLLAEILATCHPATRLCIAADITLSNEMIQTRTVGEWKKQKPDLHKRPCIFLLSAE